MSKLLFHYVKEIILPNNMTSQFYDYLIVGQGIAGTSLAWHLIDAGSKVLIVDEPDLPSSSLIASGIFNPLTGKRLVKTWLADDIFPYANKFYTNLEKKLSVNFVYNIPVFRPYRSILEQNSYLAHSADTGIASHVDSTCISEIDLKYIDAPLGGLRIMNSGYVDLPVFLESSRQYFLEKECFLSDKFKITDLKFENNSVLWKDMSFKKVILCQGAFATSNQYFNWLPFALVKGEILEIETESELLPYIINQGIFVLPTGSKLAKVGATYSWDDLDWEVTADAQKELEEKLSNLLNCPFKTLDQKAGIRPSVKDRRPLLGTHPEIPALGIFNGLGTKGVTLAPYFANDFVNHLENGKELNPFVNIKRYFSLYFH